MSMPTPRTGPGYEPIKSDSLENPLSDTPEQEGMELIDSARGELSARAKEAIELPPNRTVLDVPIEFCNEGKRIETQNRKGTYVVRIDRKSTRLNSSHSSI